MYAISSLVTVFTTTDHSPGLKSLSLRLYSPKLGEGAFGEVYLAEYGTGKNKQEVAVKTMRNEVSSLKFCLLYLLACSYPFLT
uniref:Pkinase_Tyr domain-containing protein n=1 Tax=Heterorhabditis bacteriophora TaxID=37862 RepID=A0A1I7WKF8_HETBA